MRGQAARIAVLSIVQLMASGANVPNSHAQTPAPVLAAFKSGNGLYVHDATRRLHETSSVRYRAASGSTRARSFSDVRIRMARRGSSSTRVEATCLRSAWQATSQATRRWARSSTPWSTAIHP